MQIVELLVALHRLGERGPGIGPLRERGELALVGFLEGDAVGIGAIEIALDLRIVDPGVEIGEIPFRQRTQTGYRAGGGAGLGGLFRRNAFCWCGHKLPGG